jgi:hypothetical protein
MTRNLDPCPTCKHPQRAIVVCDECRKEAANMPIQMRETIDGDTDAYDYCSIACLLASNPGLDGRGSWCSTTITVESGAVEDFLRRLGVPS